MPVSWLGQSVRRPVPEEQDASEAGHVADSTGRIVVEARSLSKVYGDSSDQVRALDGLDLTICAGEFIAIVGPSGSGKSTLLNMIGALDLPSSGSVVIGGSSLAEIRDLDRFRSRTVGFVFQSSNLIPTLTASENIEVPLYETERSGARRRARARALLALVGLDARADALPSQLSGGQRQRVAIARALANEPAIVLADEPTGNLDSKTTEDILGLLSDLNRSRGVTLIVVTHNTQVACAARRIITIRDGRIQRDVVLQGALEGDLLDWRNSALGQAIVRGEEVPAVMREIAPMLREVLDSV